jgi:Carboxypeptidase regulatory-like domain
MLNRIIPVIVFVIAMPFIIRAQETSSSIGGTVKSDKNEPLPGTTITATHNPTGTVYRVISRAGGTFNINNMQPGGPYTIVFSFVGLTSETKSDIYLTLGEKSSYNIVLVSTAGNLSEVVVAARRAPTNGKGGVESTLGRDRVANLPSVGRNISDLLRTIPQAKLTTTEGAISIAGQNNRFNAFYIDGALNNDVFGLSASGTNGGQANIPPISLDAIDQIQVSISPYDASLSGFTGGGINAITRSGTNTISGSVYYLFRNQDLAGKTPTGGKSVATKLPKFQDKTYGFRVGGAIIKNKLFYFINGEVVRFERPQVFDVSKYSGPTNLAGLLALSDTLRIKYGYDGGGFQNNPEKVRANRIVAKLDWNLNSNNKISLTYRYNDGQRYNVTSSSASTINFYNDGYIFPTTANTYTAELRSAFKRGGSNRLLLTYADVNDDRGPIGSPFPRVTINDGGSTATRIIFGPDNSSTINLLTQKNYNFLDIFRFNAGKHSFSVGTDDELNSDYNAFIQNTYGNYTYNSLSDFYTNARPSAYSVGYSLIDNKQDETTAAAAKFKTMRLAAFINDEIRPNQNLVINLAIRADKSSFITTPGTDKFTNDTALAKFSQYYDLQGARSGLKPNIPVSISPRIGFTYKIPSENLTIRGGIGIFTGRIPLVWPAGIYNNNGINQGGFTANATALNTIRFRSDPFNQWRATDVGQGISKGPLNLISKDFKIPKNFKASIAFDKQLANGWSTTAEALFIKNINEIYYTNINILPPTGTSLGPGPRTVYPFPDLLPITSTGGNPYDNAILMTNAKNNKGFSYNLTFLIEKRFQKGFTFSTSYSYGESMTLHEQTSSVNLSQWSFVETVNGRNFIARSYSDFSPGHRIISFISKKIDYLQKRLSTTISLLYTGQSGAPISYVYAQGASANPGPVRDDPNAGGNDLIYIPTAAELQTMIFLAPNTINGVGYTQQEQRDLFEAYIQKNKYLSKHRGQFADRNGDRLPFTHLIDLKIAQDFNIKIGSKRIQFEVTYDVFNFTNMLNRGWGKTYFLTNDNFAPLQFAGYVNAATNLTPQYRFNPTSAQPRSVTNISTSSAPSYSPRWTSQLGFRINF